ncbi:thiamine phosphate synthase [Arthrobacter sp. UM1]|nr:thiamine phosphate synthase [Arthrobacter sp. UM1]
MLEQTPCGCRDTPLSSYRPDTTVWRVSAPSVDNDPSVYLVADVAVARSARERGVHRLSLPEIADAAVSHGVRTVQLRAKGLPEDEAEELVRALAPATEGRALLLLNDFTAAARRLRRAGVPLDGVHIGQTDGSPLEVRELLGPDAVIGLSAEAPEHFEAIARLPKGTVDAVGIGAVRATTSKADAPAPIGFEGLARAAARAAGLGLDAVAIGGLAAGDAAAVLEAGAQGMAVVSAICAAEDPGAASAALRRDWDAALSSAAARRPAPPRG